MFNAAPTVAPAPPLPIEPAPATPVAERDDVTVGTSDVTLPAAPSAFAPTAHSPRSAHEARRAGRAAAFATAGVVAAFAAAPGAASAATASLGADGTLTITDQPAHVAVMTVSELTNPLNIAALNKIVVTDNTAMVPTPAGCTNPLGDTTTLVCDRGQVHKIALNLGDGDDTVMRPVGLTLLGVQALPVGDTPMVISGGDGNDHLEGGDEADVIDGGAGDDTIFGFGGGDTLTGGLGADRIEPGSGTNTIDTSTPEVDTIATTPGSINTATASPNDVFIGTGATTSITLLGVDVGLGGPAADGTPAAGTTGIHVNVGGDSSPTGGTGSSADVSTGSAGGAGTVASVAVSVGIPSVDDLLGGARGDATGGSLAAAVAATVKLPAGISLPLTVNAKIGANVAGNPPVPSAPPVTLPPGVTLDPGGLHIRVVCKVNCSALGNGAIDIGGSGGPLKMLPATVSMPGKGVASLNLGLGKQEYISLQNILNAGKCAVVGTRIHMKTPAGDEIQAYALPICGSKVTFQLLSHPIATGQKVSGAVAADVTCSTYCGLSSRFLLVKSGDAVIARVEDAKIAAVEGSRKVFLTSYKLSARQQRTIMGVVRGGHSNIRYVLSAHATSGGVATTGTATFRANVH